MFEQQCPDFFFRGSIAECKCRRFRLHVIYAQTVSLLGTTHVWNRRLKGHHIGTLHSRLKGHTIGTVG